MHFLSKVNKGMRAMGSGLAIMHFLSKVNKGMEKGVRPCFAHFDKIMPENPGTAYLLTEKMGRNP